MPHKSHTRQLTADEVESLRHRKRLVDKNLERFPQRLEEIIKSRVTTQTALGRKAGVDPGSMSRIMGANNHPSLYTALLLSIELDMTLDELFGIERVDEAGVVKKYWVKP